MAETLGAITLVCMQTHQIDSNQRVRPRHTYDVIVVGGGAAGLSAALMLGRARRSVLLVDGGEPRNAPAAHMYGFPSRDGSPPREFLDSARQQLSRYDVTVSAGTVRSVEKAPTGFAAELESGQWLGARRLLAATGITDALPDVPGLSAAWGRAVVHCPYCHGWELREQRIAVLASTPMSIQQALLFRQWTPRLTLLLHTQDPPDPEQSEQLSARGIRIVVGEVERAERSGGQLSGVRLVTGEHIALDAIAVAPVAVPRAGLLRRLGLTPQPHVSGLGEHIAVDGTGRTDVEGVWAAGNLTDPALNVLGSANAGAIAAGGINADLIAEDTTEAVRAARRAQRTAPHISPPAPGDTR